MLLIGLSIRAALKDEFDCEFLSRSSTEENSEERVHLHSNLSDEISFGYKTLDNANEAKYSKSPLSSRFQLNNRLRMRHSLTPNPKNTETTRLNIFRRRNTVQDHKSNENG